VDGDQGQPRWRAGLREMRRRRAVLGKLHNPRHWSEQTIVLLVMQTLDNSITTALKRRWFGRLRYLSSEPGEGEANPTWIPAGHEVARRVADKIDGTPGGTWSDLVNVPVTGHLIGGCVIGDSARTGVVDAYHRLYGYDGLHVADGSTVSVNLGVNPSLTITAQAERAMSLWPNRGDVDGRPPRDAPYVRLAPTAPRHPVVPEAARSALRLTVVPSGRKTS
jgi:cholesterol oxidase